MFASATLPITDTGSEFQKFLALGELCPYCRSIAFPLYVKSAPQVSDFFSFPIHTYIWQFVGLKSCTRR